MNISVLISCMHQKDFSIIERSNVQTDAIVVNQCDEDRVDEFDFNNKSGNVCHVKFISTTERGLSRSRNIAIKNATSDICLICDDDEELKDDYEMLILDAYQQSPNADIIAFNIVRPRKKPFEKVKKMDYLTALKVSSVHITFRRICIIKRNILFDEKMGSGTGNGGGEDTRFMRDTRKAGLSQWCNPSVIATLKDTGQSVWFNGVYTSKYFQDAGWSNRRGFGILLGGLLVVNLLILHYKDYRKDISFTKALMASLKGWNEKR